MCIPVLPNPALINGKSPVQSYTINSDRRFNLHDNTCVIIHSERLIAAPRDFLRSYLLLSHAYTPEQSATLINLCRTTRLTVSLHYLDSPTFVLWDSADISVEFWTDEPSSLTLAVYWCLLRSCHL